MVGEPEAPKSVKQGEPWMKQFCLALMIALLGTTSAYAVSLNWSSTKPTAAEDKGISFTAGTNFSVALVFSSADFNNVAESSRAATKLLAISYPGGDSPYSNAGASLGIQMNGEIYGRQFGGSNYKDTRTTLDFSSLKETNVLGIAVTFATHSTNSADYDVTYTVYLNDTQVYTTTHSEVGRNVDDFKYARTGLNNTTLYYATGTADGAAFAALPEPTVLALLALGVAGVALRRKAA